MIELHRSRRPPVFAGVVLCGLFVAIVAAQADEPAGDIFAAVRGAVAAGNVEKSRLLGFTISKTPFSETAPDGILVGFDCGVGKFGGGETVYAFRPVYRTPLGDTSFKDWGIFADVRDGNKTIKTKVLRTVKLRANAGYAVGGATVRAGLNIDGLSLTYMRIVGGRLDPAQSYVSEWVGSRKGGSDNKIEGTGNPVVGVFGNLSDDRHVQGLGFIYARGLAKPPAPPEVPAVVEPVRPPDLPVKPPVPEPKVVPEPPVALEPVPQPPAKRPVASAPPPFVPAPDDSLAKAIPFLAFGSAAITMVIVGLFFLRWKKGADQKQAATRVLIRHGKIESPSPSIMQTNPGAIRAADAAPRPFAAPTAPPEIPAKPQPAPMVGGMPSLELDDDPPPVPGTPLELPAKPQAAMQIPQRQVFFTGRMVTKTSQPLYRVYVLDNELLFLYAGPGFGDTAAGTGQAIGGIVGAMIGKAVGAEMRERTMVRQRNLDAADLAKLRQLAQQDDSFCATAADFTSMSIDAIGFWNSLTVGPDCAGVLYAKHVERGNLTLALLSLDDVRVATEELPKSLGNLVAVNVVWSDASLKYVKKS